MAHGPSVSVELFRGRGYHDVGKLDAGHETMRHIRSVTRLPARADEIVVDPPDLTRFEKVQAMLNEIIARIARARDADAR